MFPLKREYLALQRPNINFIKLTLLKDFDSKIIELFTLNLSLNTTINYRSLRFLWRFQRIFFCWAFYWIFHDFMTDWRSRSIEILLWFIFSWAVIDFWISVFCRQDVGHLKINLIMKSDPIDSRLEVMKIYYCRVSHFEFHRNGF